MWLVRFGDFIKNTSESSESYQALYNLGIHEVFLLANQKSQF